MVELKLREGRLREIGISDIQALSEICHDEEIQRFYFSQIQDNATSYWRRVFMEQLKERISPFRRRDYYLTIEMQELPKGAFRLFPPADYKKSQGIPEYYLVGFFVDPLFRGKGLATEVLKKAVSFAFDNLDAKVVKGECIADNIASQKVLEKAGFRFLDKDFDFIGSSLEEIRTYSLDKSDYLRVVS